MSLACTEAIGVKRSRISSVRMRAFITHLLSAVPLCADPRSLRKKHPHGERNCATDGRQGQDATGDDGKQGVGHGGWSSFVTKERMPYAAYASLTANAARC